MSLERRETCLRDEKLVSRQLCLSLGSSGLLRSGGLRRCGPSCRSAPRRANTPALPAQFADRSPDSSPATPRCPVGRSCARSSCIRQAAAGACKRCGARCCSAPCRPKMPALRGHFANRSTLFSCGSASLPGRLRLLCARRTRRHGASWCVTLLYRPASGCSRISLRYRVPTKMRRALLRRAAASKPRGCPESILDSAASILHLCAWSLK